MIIVTGGGSGIGRALTHALAERGERVLIIGRRAQALQETAADSELIETLAADVSEESGRQRILERLKNEPVLKALVHNAGIIEPITPLSKVSLPDWRQIMTTNVEAPLFLSQKILASFNNLRILHVGSGAAHFPVKAWGPYCTSKAALSMLTRVWQEECPDLAIASIMPGIIDTDMQAVIRHSDMMDPAKHEFFMDLKAKGQLLDCATVAAFISWLLLDVSPDEYRSQEWDIYDTQHHDRWLKPPHRVAGWEEE